VETFSSSNIAAAEAFAAADFSADNLGPASTSPVVNNDTNGNDNSHKADHNDNSDNIDNNTWAAGPSGILGQPWALGQPQDPGSSGPWKPKAAIVADLLGAPGGGAPRNAYPGLTRNP